jgi:NADH-quinone oxidoreductase subunit M
VLLGSFGRYPVLVGVGTTVVVFSAAYMLWSTQRVFFNRLTNPLNEGLADLNRRELAVVVPLILAMLWIGLYPKPILRRTESAARQYVESVEQHLPASRSPATPRSVTVGVVP